MSRCYKHTCTVEGHLCSQSRLQGGKKNQEKAGERSRRSTTSDDESLSSGKVDKLRLMARVDGREREGGEGGRKKKERKGKWMEKMGMGIR
jgi:hypothetical protein